MTRIPPRAALMVAAVSAAFAGAASAAPAPTPSPGPEDLVVLHPNGSGAPAGRQMPQHPPLHLQAPPHPSVAELRVRLGGATVLRNTPLPPASWSASNSVADLTFNAPSGVQIDTAFTDVGWLNSGGYAEIRGGDGEVGLFVEGLAPGSAYIVDCSVSSPDTPLTMSIGEQTTQLARTSGNRLAQFTAAFIAPRDGAVQIMMHGAVAGVVWAWKGCTIATAK